MPAYKGKHTAHIINKIYDQMIKAVHASENEKQKNILLYVGKIHNYTIEALNEYIKNTGVKYRIGLITDSRFKMDKESEALLDQVDIKIACDFSSPSSIQKTLKPYQDELLVITCRAENKIKSFAKIVPHVPYLSTPTSESLNWASNKILMRQRLQNHNKGITPSFAIIEDSESSTIDNVEAQVGYPLVVKPTGLAASQLVTICYHKEELIEVLKKVFKKVDTLDTNTDKTKKTQILIEQFMDGEMYSIDAYVNRRGVVYFCPMVHVKTGRSIGFDDFFGYQQITPTILNKQSVAGAEYVAEEAIHALALRSTTAHVEIMKTEDGWKIIELGARIGGFRHIMYKMSYGFNHTANDIKIRIPEKPAISKKRLGYTVAMKFFAKKEGILSKLKGIKKIQELKSFTSISIHKNIGDQCLYAKHGGKSVFDLMMFNKERSKLLADIRRVEQTIEIETSKNGNGK
ncbi:MAG: ATP-grasp domain-containing protein [bacterium]|nr:ATP-grasp domain-containing protein [bacterium]